MNRRCFKSSGSKKLLGAPGIATRSKELLGAPGLTTRSKKLLAGLTTRSKDATVTRGSWPYYWEQGRY